MDVSLGLREIGFSEKESALYLALLKLKEATAVDLAREVKIHRRTIYDNLSLLVQKGLVSIQLKGGIKYFRATNPKSLSIFLEEKKRMLASILPDMVSTYADASSTPEISVFSGISGAKTIIEEAAQFRGDVYWVGGGMYLFEELEYSRSFIEQKAKKMRLHTIQPDTPTVRETKKRVELKNVRLLPAKFSSRTGYLTFGDIVAIGIIKEKEVTTIRIKSLEAAHAFKNYFDILWKSAKTL